MNFKTQRQKKVTFLKRKEMGKKSPKPITLSNDLNSKKKILHLLNLTKETSSSPSSADESTQSKKMKITKSMKRNLHQKFITRFHTINKELENNQNLTDEKRLMLEKEKKELGGLETYQKASVKGEHLKGRFQTSKWFVKQIQDPNCDLKLILDRKNQNQIEKKTKKLRLLDVGALDENYSKQSNWIDCTSIGNPIRFTFIFILFFLCLCVCVFLF